MANRQIHGKVILDVETEGESSALADLRAKFSALTATIKVGIEVPTRKAMQAQLDTEAHKGKGLTLLIDELNLPSLKEMQLQLDVEAHKGKGLTLLIDELNLPSKKEMQVHLDSKVGAGLKLHVLLDVTNKSFLPVIAAQKAAQKALTDLEAKELAKRETARVNSATRTSEKEALASAKGDQDRLTSKQKTDNSIRLLEEKTASINLRNQQAAALRQEVIAAQLASRLEAQNNAFQQRLAFAQDRAQRQLEARANKPIIQRFLINADAVNASLTDFDRTVSRFLRTSLVGFAAWSAGVEIAFAAAAIAGVAAFAQLEQASTRAAAVVASQQRVEEIERYGKAVSSFAEVTASARARIEEVSQRTALQTLFNPTEIAGGIQQLLQAGQTTEEAFKNIGAAANFATVNGRDLLETSEGLATALASAGLSADQSALLLDKITLTAADAVGNVDDYFKAFANGAAASGRIIGATTDETLFLLRLLGQSGKVGLEAGTSADIIFRDLGKAAVKSAKEWEDYGITANGTISEQLVGLARVVDATGGNRVEQAKLRKDLGFQEKSFRAIARILPQITALGNTEAERLAAVNRELNSTAKGAKGLVDLQLGELRKNVAFQFDQLKDSFVIAFQEFGRGAGEATSDLFDVFAGSDGLIKDAIPAIQEFGRQFGEVIADIVRFIQTPAFLVGIDNLVEAVRVTLAGVSEAFQVFSAAFNDASSTQSVFVAVTESILAFARVSAAVLPVIARILGTIFDFLIDNADAFETFAKLTVALFLARKAYVLLIKPLATVTSLVIAQATAYGLMGGAANKATASIAALTIAQANQARASTASTVSAGVSALGMIPGFPGRGIFRGRNRAAAIGTQGRAGVDALGVGAAHADAALAARNAAAFDRLSASLSLANVSGKGLAGTLGRIGFVGAAAAGILVAGKGAISGFGAALEESSVKAVGMETSMGRLARSMAPLTGAVSLAMDTIVTSTEEAGREVGRSIGQLSVGAVNSFADAVSGVALRIQGDLEGSDDAFFSLGDNVKKTAAAAAILVPGLATMSPTLYAIADSANAAGDGIDYASGKMDTSVSIIDQVIGRYYALRDARDALDRKESNTKWFVAMKRRNAASRQQSATEAEISRSVAAYTAAMKNATAGSSATDTAAASTKKLATASEQAAAAVDKMSGSAIQSKALEVIGKATSGAAKGYQATRVEAEILRRVLPSLDRELEKQRSSVQKLDQALQTLQATQIKGTRAFSDQLFANEQQVKALQLQRVDLIIGGAAEEDSSIVSLDEQIRALQLQAERTSLAESLELDPLRRKLTDTFSPITELPFDEILGRFKKITDQKSALTDAIAGGENLRAVLDKTIGEAEQRFETAGKDVSAGLARGVIAGSKGVLEAGRKNAQAALTGLNEVLQFGSPSRTAMQRGLWVAQGLSFGINAGAPGANASATSLGTGVMASMLAGLKQGFGTPEVIGSVAWYLNVFIPKWIRDNKGPVSYDATILVPAGQAVMEGFGKGLRSGFADIQGFVKDVGPSLKEFVTGADFNDRTATIMADIAIGKTPDIEGALGDLRLAATPGYFSGVADPALSFLHPTLSLADTIQQAFGIIKALGGGLNTGGPGQISRPDGTTTSSGNISAHTEGTAADIGTGGGQPTAASLDLFAKAKALLGKVFQQVIHNGIGLNAGGGSFGDSDHGDHVHLQWLKGLGFGEDSGKIGAPPVINIPGASNIVDQAIGAAAKKHGIELAVLAGLFKQESSFNPNVISADGGYGLAQLTSAGLLRQVGFNRLDPFRNADVGAGYLKGMLNKYGNVPDAVGAYNAGSKPFPASTRNFHIPNVMRNIEEFRRIFGSGKFGGFRALGGDVYTGKNYVVGERGPEIFTPTRSGSIIPNNEAMLSGGGGRSMTYQDNRSIQVTTAATDAEAVAALVDARTRVRFTGVNFR